jgi:hypothetical protein
MSPREFFINPADYGLPTRDELVAYRIWDNHFHGFLSSSNPIEQYERNNFFVERMGIERSISQEIGGTLEEPFAPYEYDAEILKILERDKDRLSGRTPIDPGFPDESCAKIVALERHERSQHASGRRMPDAWTELSDSVWQRQPRLAGLGGGRAAMS